MSVIQIVIVSGLGIAAIAGLWVLERRRKIAPPVLAERPDMTTHDIYAEFYRGSLGAPEERFSAWWHEIAEAFEVSAGRIRPGDRFGIELPFRPVFGMTDEDMSLGGTLRRHVGRQGVKALPSLETVDQFIRYLATNAKG